MLTEASAPALQNSLKNTGKNPAITVVAKAELAQSYIAHDTILAVSYHILALYPSGLGAAAIGEADARAPLMQIIGSVSTGERRHFLFILNRRPFYIGERKAVDARLLTTKGTRVCCQQWAAGCEKMETSRGQAGGQDFGLDSRMGG